MRTVSDQTIQIRRLLHLAQIAIIALAALAAAPAAAQDADKARQLFQQGSKYYDLGQFDKAIEAWQQGYDQKPDPGFLYNIAQAHRQKQDATKAIFFYKGYLRNSPKAHNRAEVEKRIVELQKQLDAATPPANTPPPTNGTPPPPNNTTTPPANTTAPPPADNQQPPPITPPPAFTDAQPAVAQTFQPPPPVINRPFDLTAGIGPAFWTSGVNGDAKPSFVLTFMGGYTFGQPTSRFRFRAGALLGYTFLGANDDMTNVTFLSFLLDPTLDVRLTQSGQWHLTVDLGFGIQMLSGLKPGSKLLLSNEQLTVNGAQGMFETRLGLGVSYRVLPELALFASVSQMDSKKKQHFFADITRNELLFGCAYRF